MSPRAMLCFLLSEAQGLNKLFKGGCVACLGISAPLGLMASLTPHHACATAWATWGGVGSHGATTAGARSNAGWPPLYGGRRCRNFGGGGNVPVGVAWLWDPHAMMVDSN
jgi:hypothetical protein